MYRNTHYPTEDQGVMLYTEVRVQHFKIYRHDAPEEAVGGHTNLQPHLISIEHVVELWCMLHAGRNPADYFAVEQL